TRTIVFGEHDKLSVWVGVRKSKDVTNISTLEAVDCLVVVTYYQNVWVTFIHGAISKRVQNTKLCEVGVLELVYHDVEVAFLQVKLQVIVYFNAMNDLHNHVVVIE